MSSTRPTTAVIAKEAEVAVSTVSKALNGHTDTSATTRETVERPIVEHGYQLPRAARNGRRSGKLIDLVINEFGCVCGRSILNGVAQVLEHAGLALVVDIAECGSEVLVWGPLVAPTL